MDTPVILPARENRTILALVSLFFSVSGELLFELPYSWNLCGPGKLLSVPELTRTIKQASNDEEQESHPPWAHYKEK